MKNKSKIISILNTKLTKNTILRNFHFITINNETRWLIEDDFSTIDVLREWKPYSKKGNLFWKILIFFKILRLINLLPVCKKNELEISKELFNFNKEIDLKKTSIVCFFSRVSHINYKAIIFLINKEKRQCDFIVKKAISARSWESLQHEYLVLKNLEKSKNKYSPKSFNLDKTNKLIFQEFIKGKPSSLYLQDDHYSFLGSLVNKNKYINLKKLNFLFNSFFERKIKFSPNKALIKDLEKVLSLSIWDKKIRSVRVHGDFAPWNIKIEYKTKNLKVFDWENSINSFLPFYDLLFYKLTVQKLLKKRIKIEIQKYLHILNLNGYKLKDEYINDLIFISKIFFIMKSDFNLYSFEKSELLI